MKKKNVGAYRDKIHPIILHHCLETLHATRYNILYTPVSKNRNVIYKILFLENGSCKFSGNRESVKYVQEDTSFKFTFFHEGRRKI